MRRRTQRPGRSLGFESLEGRQMMAAVSLGSEARVNQFVPGLQVVESGATAVVATTSGYAAVYEGRGPTDRHGIFVRRLSTSGTAVGDAVQVNVTEPESQHTPAIAALPSGGFVIAWAGRGRGDQEGIFARWFDGAGQPLTSEVLINTTTGGRQSNPAVAATADGIVVFAWQGVGAGDVSGIFARGFSAARTPLSSELLVNATTGDHQVDPAIAAAASGFVVAWSSRHQDGSDWAVEARRITTSGAANGGEFLANVTTQRSQVDPSVAPLANNQFAIGWSSRGQDGNSWSVLLRRFASDGTPLTGPLGGEQIINTLVAGHQQDVSLSGGGGRLVAAWTSGVPDGSGWEVFAQAFAVDGSRDGANFRVNSARSGPNSGNQRMPSVAVGGSSALILWQGEGTTDHRGVHSQGLRLGDNRSPDLETIANRTAIVGTVLRVAVRATDPDGDTLTIVLDPDQAPASASIVQVDNNNADISWTPAAADGPGPFLFRVLVTDALGAVDQQSFQVTLRQGNQIPNLDAIANQAAIVGTPLRVAVRATDPDGDAMTIVLDPDQAPASASIAQSDSNNAVISWTPAAADGPGPFLFRVLATDAFGAVDQQSFQVTLRQGNRAPNLEAITNRTATVNSQLQVQVRATDPDGDPVTIVLDPDQAPASATLAMTDANNGVISWTPQASDGAGPFLFRVLVTDVFGAVDQQSFQVTLGA